ncbi:MAG: hypothetical protein K5985_10195 [Lachnospiraceae bacterium]|nr:hypothetical protein [Lachnospiraceae bacterium]
MTKNTAPQGQLTPQQPVNQTQNQTPVQIQTQNQIQAQNQTQQNIQQVQKDSARWLSDRTKDNIENTVQGIVSEVNVGKHVSAKSKWRREKAFNRKKEVYDARVCEQWRAKRKDGSQTWRKQQTPQLQQPQQLKDFANDIRDMVECTTTFMNYTDDQVFINNFSDSSKELERYAALKDILAGKTQGDIDGLNIPELKGVKLGVLQKKAADYSDILDFYRAKMDVISNSFYMVLRKTDTLGLKLETLREKEKECRADKREELADYLDAIIRLREIEARGTSRDSQDKAVYGGQTKEGLHSKHAGASFAVLTKDSEVDVLLGVKGEHSVENRKEDKKKEFGALEGEEEETTDEKIIQNEIKVGAEVSASGTVRAVEAKAYSRAGGDDSYARAGAEAWAAVGEAQAKGSVGASIGWDFEEGLVGDIGVSAEASVALAKGKVGASASFLKGFFKDFFGISVEAEGAVLEGNASGVLKGGRFFLNGKEQVGVAGVLQAGANAASATGRIGITLFGIKFTGSAQGQVGVGATAGGYLTTSGVGLSLGAVVGVGGTLGLDVDVSFWTDKLKNLIVRKVKEVRKK